MRLARPSIVLLAALVMLVSACARPGTDSSPTPDAQPPQVREPREPIDPGDGEALIGALRRYADEHADEFAGLYMHPPGSGSFVVMFTGRLEEHAAALAAISPRVSVAPARFTEAELLELMERLDLEGFRVDGVEPLSTSLDTINNRIELELKSNDPTIGPRLEAGHGGRLKVTVHPLPGPWRHAEAGDGWRLLEVIDAGHDQAHMVRAATDGGELAELWSAIGGAGAPPTVAFDREVVVSFGHGIGSSCPEVRLDGVDLGGGLVTSVASDPLAPRACTADLAGAIVFVVALERDALPAGSFGLALTEQFGERIEVPLR